MVFNSRALLCKTLSAYFDAKRQKPNTARGVLKKVVSAAGVLQQIDAKRRKTPQAGGVLKKCAKHIPPRRGEAFYMLVCNPSAARVYAKRPPVLLRFLTVPPANWSTGNRGRAPTVTDERARRARRWRGATEVITREGGRRNQVKNQGFFGGFLRYMGNFLHVQNPRHASKNLVFGGF